MIVFNMDAWFVTAVVLGVITKSSTVLRAEWQTSPDPVIYACQGKTVQFPWKLNIDPRSEFVETVHWFYQGTFSSDLFATHTHGQFLPALKYAGRVVQLQDRGVALRDVTPSDAGNYSVEALVRQRNASLVSHLYSQSVYLQVSDSLMIQGGRLEVTQDPVALWDNTSEQWTIRLWCGKFTFKGQPPVRVEWMMPSGEVRPSSGYSGRKFYLSLAAPVLPEGNYTCRVPQQFYPDLCSTDKGADKLLGYDLLQASIVVDEVRARLTLAEADLGRLRLDNGRLESTVENLTDNLSVLKSDLLQMQQSLMPEIQALWNATKPIEDFMDKCSHISYTSINDTTGLRNRNHSSGNLCDNTMNGWYRWFLNGQNAVIPNTCTPVERCSTRATLWIDLQGQSLPGVGQEVQARVCASWLNNVCCAGNAFAEELKIPPDEIVYACSGDTAFFPWNNNNKTELPSDVKWSHRLNNGLHKMVAFYSNHVFLPADQRMSRLADNRLTLHNVTVSDTGLYVVEAKYTDNTQFNFTFYLQVSDSPMVRDQQLQVTQDSVVLWNKTSSQWTIRLLCGTFTFLGNDAPVQVEWILPDEKTRVSNEYEKGHFYLTLSAPVKADTKYTCRIPKRYYPNICLTGKTKASALTEASLFLDEGKTKLIMMEAEQERVKDTLANLSSAVAGYFEGLKSELLQMQQSLKGEITSLWNETKHIKANQEKCLGRITYRTINDSAGVRGLNHSASYLCDKRMTAGWYRWFLYGQDAIIPTSCTPEQKCGTYATMWIDLKGQSLPAVGREVQGRACAHYSSNCCHWEVPSVTVRNCGSYYIYHLSPAPKCYLAYCLQSII